MSLCFTHTACFPCSRWRLREHERPVCKLRGNWYAEQQGSNWKPGAKNNADCACVQAVISYPSSPSPSYSLRLPAGSLPPPPCRAPPPRMADATRTSSASEHSSRLTHVATEQSPPQDPSSPEKFISTHSVELDLQPPELEAQPPSRNDVVPETRSRLNYRVRRVLHLDHPRVLRVWHYVRGPRPKVELPGTYNVI